MLGMQSFLASHRASDTRCVTHLNLTGGKYEIRTDVGEFRNLYAKTRNPMHLVERVLYPSRFFVDVDKYPDAIDGLFHEVTKHFPCVVMCVCTEGETGIHLIFPDVVVHNPEDANTTCARLCDRVPVLAPFVDKSVYRSGLRMLGSHKSATVQRAYSMYGSNHSNPTRVSAFDLGLCSIHHGIHGQPPVSITSKPAPSTRRLTGSIHVDFSVLNDAYKAVCVFDVKKYGTGDRYYTLLCNNRFCQNIMEEHRSKCAYFVVDVRKKEVTQRCLCKCQTKSCSSFISHRAKIGLREFYKIKEYVKGY